MNSTKNFINSSNLLMECLKSEKIESGPMYGQFLIDSLNSGQGITIGNLLRRVLLGDLQGTAITGVRIAGIKDEFSLIPGVREDILEILLNLNLPFDLVNHLFVLLVMMYVYGCQSLLNVLTLSYCIFFYRLAKYVTGFLLFSPYLLLSSFLLL